MERKRICWLSSSPKTQKKAAVSVDSIVRLRTLTEQWTSNRLCFSVQSQCNITCKYPDITEQEKQVFYKMHDQCKLLFLAFDFDYYFIMFLYCYEQRGRELRA